VATSLTGPYSDDEIEAALDALSEPERLAGAQDMVARFAPQLQRILNEALYAGGWFGAAHDGQVSQIADDPDAEKRRIALGTLLAEETRLAMFVGVAVGVELARELSRHPNPTTED
jgi:anti-sigma factor RsiW